MELSPGVAEILRKLQASRHSGTGLPGRGFAVFSSLYDLRLEVLRAEVCNGWGFALLVLASDFGLVRIWRSIADVEALGSWDERLGWWHGHSRFRSSSRRG